MEWLCRSVNMLFTIGTRLISTNLFPPPPPPLNFIYAPLVHSFYLLCLPFPSRTSFLTSHPYILALITPRFTIHTLTNGLLQVLLHNEWLAEPTTRLDWFLETFRGCSHLCNRRYSSRGRHVMDWYISKDWLVLYKFILVLPPFLSQVSTSLWISATQWHTHKSLSSFPSHFLLFPPLSSFSITPWP